jgi:hypothetical protein
MKFKHIPKFINVEFVLPQFFTTNTPKLDAEVGLDGIIRVNNDAIAAAEVTGGSQ